MEPVQQQELHLRDYLRIFRKRFRLILGVMVLVAGVVLAVSYTSPRIYQAGATVQVQGQTGYIIRASTPLDDSGGNLTPTGLTELVARHPYQELAASLMILAEGYDMDLTARRSQDEMVRLFEEDLFMRGLPAYFGRLALRAEKDSPRRMLGLGGGLEPSGEDKSAADEDAQLSRRLSSARKDEAIKQAGALAALARRSNTDLFSLGVDAIEPQAIKIMNTPLIRNLRSNPLKGKRWEQLPPLERAAAVQAAYREVKKRFPDDADERNALERYTTREVRETGMLSIAFESPDPFRAMIGADAMVDAVVWKNQYLRKEDAQKMRQIAETALTGVDGNGGALAQLRETDRLIRDYKNNRNLPDLEFIKEARSKQFAELQTDYQAALAGMQGASQQVRLLTAKLKQLSPSLEQPTVADDPSVSGLRGELITAEADLQKALAEFTEEHPAVEALTAKVERLRKSVQSEETRNPQRREVRQIPNPEYEQVSRSLLEARGELSGFEAKEAALRVQLDRAEAQLATVPDTEYNIANLMRRQFALQENVKSLQEKLMEAELNERSKGSNAKVVELAMEPGKKIRPRRTVSLILGLMLGLFLGLAGAVMAETMDHRLHTREEAERALPGTRVLASIPTFTGAHPLVVRHAGRSAPAEAYRTLRSALRFLGLERTLQAVVVTSPGFKEGKSTVAANLAAAMAQSGQRVILVDGDLRKPAQHEIMDADNRLGLTSILLNEATVEEALKPTEIEGLSVLPVGPTPHNPAELLDSAAMRRVMADLRERADLILLDSPPVGMVTDAAILASMSDGVLLVAAGGVTSRETLVQAHRTLEQAWASVLGVAFNRADSPSKSGGPYEAYPLYSENGHSSNGHQKSERRTKVKR